MKPCRVRMCFVTVFILFIVSSFTVEGYLACPHDKQIQKKTQVGTEGRKTTDGTAPEEN